MDAQIREAREVLRADAAAAGVEPTPVDDAVSAAADTYTGARVHHNAGGLSFTEALVAGLPAVTYLPIAGHGRANAELLARATLAPWPRDPAELVAAIDEVMGRPRSVAGHLREAADADADAAAVVAALVAADSLPRPASA